MRNQPENTLPLVNGTKRLTRQFDGKTENFENKKERIFFGKILKAYLKGATQFVTGRDEKNEFTYSAVEQSYLYV